MYLFSSPWHETSSGTKLKTPVGEHVFMVTSAWDFMVTSAWETGRRSFLFQAATAAEKDAWLKVIGRPSAEGGAAAAVQAAMMAGPPAASQVTPTIRSPTRAEPPPKGGSFWSEEDLLPRALAPQPLHAILAL